MNEPRGLATNPQFQDRSGEWCGSLLIVHRMPTRPQAPGRKRGRARWNCYCHDSQRFVTMTSGDLNRLQRKRDRELAEHAAALAAAAEG